MPIHFPTTVRLPTSLAVVALAALAGCHAARPAAITPPAPPAASLNDAAVELPAPPPPPPPRVDQHLTEMNARLATLPPNADARMLLQAAGMARAMGDYLRTEAYLRAILMRDPKDPGARLKLAGTLERLGRLSEARALYADLNRDTPDDLRPTLGLASVALENGDRGGAWDWLDRAAKQAAIGPRRAQDLALVAQRYADWDDLARAEATLKQALAASPDDPALLQQQADLLLRTGDCAGCRALLDRLVARDASSGPAWKSLVALYLSPCSTETDAGRLAQAAEASLRLNGRDPEAAAQAGNLYRRLDQPRHAARAYAAALMVNPAQADARYGLALVYARLGRAELAAGQRALYDREAKRAREARILMGAVSQAPARPEPHRRLADFLESTGDDAGAVRELQAAVVLDPASAQTRARLTAIYRRLGWGAPPEVHAL